MKHVIFFLLLFAITAVQSTANGQQPVSRPNILLIIADDMSPTAGIYGDSVISTPGIDRLGRQGVVFENAFCTAASCSPSRASILTGRYPHQLEEGGNLWGTLPVSFPTYTRLLSQNGYRIGLTGKGWGPGDFTSGGYKENPAGPAFESFDQFITDLPEKTPFCFWIGSYDPHRPYEPGLRKTTDINEKALKIPSWLPDSTQVREDLLDYYAEVKRFDRTVEHAISLLKEKGLYENTLIIITSDNGMPFPRAKANVYDAGSNIPLIMRWGNRFKNGARYKELVSLVDLSPTILDAAAIAVPETIEGKSLLPLLSEGKTEDRFQTVFIERERHANVRKDNLGYPVRAVRTPDYLYIHNLRPERWPAGDPDGHKAVGTFGDIDNGLTKKLLVDNRDNPQLKKQAAWSLEKRPAEELYDLREDPGQLRNLADDPSYADIKKQLQARLSAWRELTRDPLLNSEADIFDSYPYYGGGYKRNNK